MDRNQEQIDLKEVPGIVSTRLGTSDSFEIDIVDKNLKFQVENFNGQQLHTVAKAGELFYLIRFNETASVAKYLGKRELVIICAHELVKKVSESHLMGKEFSIIPVYILDVEQNSTLVVFCHNQEKKYVISYPGGMMDFTATA